MPDGVEPSLFNAKSRVTPLFIEIQMCEKFSINPMENFVGKDGDWNSDEGRALKTLLYAYCLLNNEEERRQLDDMKDKTGRQS